MKTKTSRNAPRNPPASSQTGLGFSTRMTLSRPLGAHHLRFLGKFQMRKSFGRASGIFNQQIPRVGLGLKQAGHTLKTSHIFPEKYRFLKAPSSEQAASAAWRSLDMALAGREIASSLAAPAPFGQPAFQASSPGPAMPSLGSGQVIPRLADDPAFRGGKKASAQPAAAKPAFTPNQRLYRRVEEIVPGEPKESPAAAPDAPRALPHMGARSGRAQPGPRAPEPPAPPLERIPAPFINSSREPDFPLPDEPAAAPLETPMPRRPRPAAPKDGPPSVSRMAARPVPAPDSSASVQREIEPGEPARLRASEPGRSAPHLPEQPTTPANSPQQPPPNPDLNSQERKPSTPPEQSLPRPARVHPPEIQPSAVAPVVRREEQIPSPSPSPAPAQLPAVPPASSSPSEPSQPLGPVQRIPAAPRPEAGPPKPVEQPTGAPLDPPDPGPRASAGLEAQPARSARLPLEVRRIQRPAVRPQEGTVRREIEIPARVQPAPSQPIVPPELDPASAPGPESAPDRPAQAELAGPPSARPVLPAQPGQPPAPALVNPFIRRIQAVPSRRSFQTVGRAPSVPTPVLPAAAQPPAAALALSGLPELARTLPGPAQTAQVESPAAGLAAPASVRIASRMAALPGPRMSQSFRRVLRKASAPGQVQREPALEKGTQSPAGQKQPLTGQVLALAASPGLQMAQHVQQKYRPQPARQQPQPELTLPALARPGQPLELAPNTPAVGGLPGQVITHLVEPPAPKLPAPSQAGTVQRVLEDEPDAAPVTADQSWQPPSALQVESSQPPALDLVSVAEQVYPVILRKLAEEKRRSGR